MNADCSEKLKKGVQCRLAFSLHIADCTLQIEIYVGRNVCQALFAYTDGIENGKYVFMPF